MGDRLLKIEALRCKLIPHLPSRWTAVVQRHWRACILAFLQTSDILVADGLAALSFSRYWKYFKQ